MSIARSVPDISASHADSVLTFNKTQKTKVAALFRSVKLASSSITTQTDSRPIHPFNATNGRCLFLLQTQVTGRRL